jgi:hypothetical protein
MLARLAGLRSAFVCMLALSAVALAGCSSKTTPVYDSDFKDPRLEKPDGGIFGGSLFGNSRGSGQQDGTGIGVNAFLWRGTLDTLSFMPLASADPFGGVIITDWYQPATGGERFKATAYILGRELRADALRLSVFRQVVQNGQWVDAPVDPATVTEIENRILARAREMRAEVVNSAR